jgi:penicillin-binding protein 1A
MRFFRKLILWGGGLALCAGLGLVITLRALRADPDLPRIRSLRDYHPRVVTRVLAADGSLVGEIFEERRTVVPFEKIPKGMVDAIIAAEDADFFHHKGLDYLGMLRALVANLRAGHVQQGGSTITQQLAKTFFLTRSPTLRYKVQQVVLAREIESALSKQEILYLYLNQIYFGHGRYGLVEAARFYFAKPVDKLTIGECAVLAALPKGPEQISPLRHPDRAKARQRYVLKRMVELGTLDQQTAEAVAAAPIRLVRSAAPPANLAPEWLDYVRRQLVERFGEDKVPFLGIQVRTTMDVGLQRAARRAVERGLQTLDERQGYRGPVERLPTPAAIAKKLSLLGKSQREPLTAGEAYLAVVTKVDDSRRLLHISLGTSDGGELRGIVLLAPEEGRYNPAKRVPSEWLQTGDVVPVRLAPERSGRAPRNGEGGADGSAPPLPVYALELGPQAALVAIDPTTRDVKAMVGGYGFGPGSFNRALRAQRQPGSSFKPFLYAAAFDSGRFTPASVLNDAPEVYSLWKPQNAEREEFLGPVRLRVALARSINTVAIKLLSEVGIDPVRQLAARCGIQSELANDLSLALGSSAVRPVELVNAFATFAAGGRRAEPRFLVAIGDEPQPKAESTSALRPEVAYLVTSLLRSVVEEGTARAALRLQRPVVGKTGTSNGGRDAWFVGYSPQLVAGVWVGFDDMRKLGRGEAGARAALPIWIDLFAEGLRSQPVHPFGQPAGIVVQQIDPGSGLLAPPGATGAREEVFISGTQPTDMAHDTNRVDPNAFDLEQAGSP